VVKATPGWVLTGTQSFNTKGEAERFAIDQRKQKTAQGYKVRYQLDYNPYQGMFYVKEFYYLTDNKGNLVDASSTRL
jgi:hypothetical protein